MVEPGAQARSAAVARVTLGGYWYGALRSYELRESKGDSALNYVPSPPPALAGHHCRREMCSVDPNAGFESALSCRLTFSRSTLRTRRGLR